MKVSKNTFFAISLIGTVGYFLTSGIPVLTFWCGRYNYECWDKFDSPHNFLLLFLSILIFSAITYFLREQVFRAWLKFAYGWIPFSIILIALAANSSGGGWAIPNVLDQEFVALILSGLFALISLLIILVSWLRSRSA